MPYDPNKRHRRSIRLKGYDYSQAGAYYLTIVAQHRVCLFGDIMDATIQLNDAGEMLWEQWLTLPQRFPNVDLDEFVVMPNHVHGILLITEPDHNGESSGSPVSTPNADPAQNRRGAPLWSPNPLPNPGQAQGTAPTPNPTLGNILGAWKSLATNKYIQGVKQFNWEPFEQRLFQRNYWEYVIRTDTELEMIRDYIANNPANWNGDDHNPNNPKIT